MVGGAVARPTATPEPDVRLSPHPAPQCVGHCHWYRLLFGVRLGKCAVGVGARYVGTLSRVTCASLQYVAS